MMNSATLPRKKIRWNFSSPDTLLSYNQVHTVCEESRCPNRFECSTQGIATFLIGGRECTRSCRFCHIATAKPIALEKIMQKEEADILNSVRAMQYKYLVVTSVARDDDEMLLAKHFANITQKVRSLGVEIELLIPDFHGRADCLDLIAQANPTVIAQNLETVERLSPQVRPQASYERTLGIFDFLHDRYPHIIRKSAMMLGLGETTGEVVKALDDMRAHHVDVVSVGQYLQPSENQISVAKTYTDAEFELIESEIQNRNFLAWETGPFVRSSYMAAATMTKLKVEIERRKNEHG